MQWGKADHDAVMLRLPWLVNGSLTGRERARVLAHLRRCPVCRDERDRLQEIGRIVCDDGTTPGEDDYREAFGRLMNRIEVHEANRESVSGHDRPETWWRSAPSLAVAAMLVLALGVVVMLNPARLDLPAEEFTTLTQTTDSASGTIRRIELTFEAGASSDQVRAALIRTGSSIVSGPGMDGTYVVDVAMPANAAPESFLQSVARLEGVSEVTFAREAGAP